MSPDAATPGPAQPAGRTVTINDTTLRDGEQQTGIIMTLDDKIRIAEALAEAGVHRIEAGLPAVSPADEQAIRAIASRGLPSVSRTIARSSLSTSASRPFFAMPSSILAFAPARLPLW